MPRDKPLVDAESMRLDEWLAIVTMPEHKRKVKLIDYQFPTDAHRAQFLQEIHTYPELTIRALL